MPDMLVKTYELPGWQDLKDELEQDGIIIKQALMPEMGRLAAFAREHFSEGWASEVMAALPTSRSDAITPLAERRSSAFPAVIPLPAVSLAQRACCPHTAERASAKPCYWLPYTI
jgi:hypothetical protein